MGGFSLSEGRVKLVCRTLQTVPDILYGLMNGLITCRYAPACRVRGRSRPNGRLLGACPAPPCSCPASAQLRGGPASAPARPRESYCLNNLRSEKLRSCRAPEPRGRKCGNLCFVTETARARLLFKGTFISVTYQRRTDHILVQRTHSLHHTPLALHPLSLRDVMPRP